MTTVFFLVVGPSLGPGGVITEVGLSVFRASRNSMDRRRSEPLSSMPWGIIRSRRGRLTSFSLMAVMRYNFQSSSWDGVGMFRSLSTGGAPKLRLNNNLTEYNFVTLSNM